jgi:hypothetical protein
MPRLMVICEVPIDSGASALSNLIPTRRVLGLICYVTDVLNNQQEKYR